jgi:NADH dehydrogenase FAD-containing subunit
VIVRSAVDGTRTELHYDHLVYALGSSIDVGGVPGAREYAYTLDEGSARTLASRMPELAAANGRVLIVGAGNTGVEVATELAERWPELRVTVVTRRSFAANLSDRARRHIRRAFDRLHIDLLEDTEVTRLDDGTATTRTGSIPFDACIWVGGFAVSDLARRAGIEVNDRGQILVDRALRSLSHPEIYAAGDAAATFEDPGTPVRMSLYAATPMGAHAADSLAARLAGNAPTAFGLSYIAMGLSLGRRDGVLQFLHPNSDTPFDLVLTGRLANRARDFFVWFVIRSIELQRTAPWTFIWPGKSKMRSQPVPDPAEGSAERVRANLKAA